MLTVAADSKPGATRGYLKSRLLAFLGGRVFPYLCDDGDKNEIILTCQRHLVATSCCEGLSLGLVLLPFDGACSPRLVHSFSDLSAKVLFKSEESAV